MKTKKVIPTTQDVINACIKQVKDAGFYVSEGQITIEPNKMTLKELKQTDA